MGAFRNVLNLPEKAPRAQRERLDLPTVTRAYPTPERAYDPVA